MSKGLGRMNGYSKSFLPARFGGGGSIMLIVMLMINLSSILTSSCCDGATYTTLKRSTAPLRMFGLVPNPMPFFHGRANDQGKSVYLHHPPSSLSSSVILDLRGGASKKKNRSRTGSLTKKTVTGKKKVGAKKKEESSKTKTAATSATDYYNNIPPITRIYVTMIGVCTLLGLLLGEERAQAVLALDPMRLIYGMEIWRPFTAASFLGKPSTSWLMSAYYLHDYGSSLETAYGPADYLVFLATQVSLLTLLSMMLGVPFFTSSVITGMLWVLSRATPQAKARLLVISLPYWVLPYGLMVSDCLQAQQASAAIPHILGIMVGHFYYFHRFIWPKTGGEEWLRAPDFLVELMDPNRGSKGDAAKKSIANALKKRKRGKGRKLGSA